MDDLGNLTPAQKCMSIWRSVCEGRDVDFTYEELEALQAAGFIKNLRRVHPYVGKKRGKEERWVMEWTDKLRDLAVALNRFTVKHPGYDGPTCKHGIAEGHCPECEPTDTTGTKQRAREEAENAEVRRQP